MSSKSFLNRKNFVLIHYFLESGFSYIIAFSDNYEELKDLVLSHPLFCSACHKFYVCKNKDYGFIRDVKDKALINICKNVADYLAAGEYAMLKKSYFKASSWFDKAKNSSVLGVDIVENY